jgi:exosortase
MKLPVAPSWVGLVVILFCLFTYWVGYRGNFYFIGYASIHVMIAGVTLWLWGWRHFKATSFAWVFLSFAWPYLFLEDTFAFQLRYFMVAVTAKLLSVCGFKTLQDGTALISAATGSHPQGALFNVHVDGPCSGMRSLFALMMIGALLGYFRQRTFWRRLTMFVASIPLAVLANMVRILILIFAAMLFGQDFAIGKENFTSSFHLITGFVCFLGTVAAGLFGLSRLLNRFFGREKPLAVWREE